MTICETKLTRCISVSTQEKENPREKKFDNIVKSYTCVILIFIVIHIQCVLYIYEHGVVDSMINILMFGIL